SLGLYCGDGEATKDLGLSPLRSNLDLDMTWKQFISREAIGKDEHRGGLIEGK
ncbi:hypothetical protein SLEP1_g59989, partial [Rubroshorea leprosula]